MVKGDGVNVMVADPGPQVEDKDAGATPASALFWDRRYLEGHDGWDLGKPAPPLQEFLTHHPLGPQPPGRVLVPGCGRGHEARLLAQLGFAVVGLDFSAEAIAAARQVAAPPGANLRWLQANLFDRQALAAAGLGPASLQGVVEHTCFCAIEPQQRPAYLHIVAELLVPGGWLLGLFWCHGRPAGPPYGSDPGELAGALAEAGLLQVLWQPAPYVATGPQQHPRDNEWLGLWHKPPSP
jgi:thiopurine S-methyltransferase